MDSKRLWTLAHVLLLAFCAASLAQAAEGIKVTLEPLRHTLGKSDDVLVTVTLTNTGASAQRVLKWRTPFEGVEAPLFSVTRDGLPVRYLGIRVKRAAPTEADYILLAPGASRSVTVELSALYEMSVTGSYAVRYHAGAAGTHGGAGMRGEVAELKSEPVSIWIEGRYARGISIPPPRQMAAETDETGISFRKCSNAQQDTLLQAVGEGRAMTADGLAYLVERKPQGERYTTWFGVESPERVAKVTKNFAAIRDAFDTKPLQIDCGCNASYYAYVYPARPYTVYVCKAFWKAPMTGTDSKGGTLLHELSHFDVVAATDDHVYGQAGAAELARNAPERAVNNADSHEYFGENTP